MDTEAKQAVFEGWAIVELMGHQREIGYVTTEAFGLAVLFRVDVPELPEREFELTQPEYTGENNVRARSPAGAKVKRAASPARSRLVAPSALYAMNPCTEQAARTALERARPLILIALPPGKELAAPESFVDPESNEDFEPDEYDSQDATEDTTERLFNG
jgi:hypothetical protein